MIFGKHIPKRILTTFAPLLTVGLLDTPKRTKYDVSNKKSQTIENNHI